MTVRRLKPYVDLPSRLMPCPDELSDREAGEESQVNKTFPHVHQHLENQVHLELLPDSEWEVCTSINTIRVHEVLRLLFHGGTSIVDSTRFYFARVDYINRRRSWIRLKWLPGSMDQSVVGKSQGMPVANLFKFYDVWRGVLLRPSRH